MTTLVQLLAAAAAAADMWMDFSSFWTPSGFINHTVPLGSPCSPRQAWMNSSSHMQYKHIWNAWSNPKIQSLLLCQYN
jgi:hypothetical protein